MRLPVISHAVVYDMSADYTRLQLQAGVVGMLVC